MPISYPGNPAGGSLTTPAPGRHVIPRADIPVDSDPPNAATFDPGYETALDWAAYLNVGGALGDALGGGATSFDGSANPTTWNDMLTTDGAPISGLDVLPTFAAASAFNVTIGAGSGYLNTSVGIGPGESTYRTIYWATQNLTLANPDPSLPRFDVITVTPAAFGSPSTLAVITGTPGFSLLAPAVPSGSAALFYVYVASSVPNSGSFRACRGLWRRVGYPWSGMSAIIAGCELSWDYTADPASASAQLFVGAADQTGTAFTVNRLLIDGELIEWAGWSTSADADSVQQDSTSNPFATAASSSFDRPYYIYAVGGRHNPMPTTNGVTLINPVAICESTVPPNPKTGKPTANLTVNGVTVTPNGAVYIGLGFVVQGTTNRRACLMDGEMTCAMNPLQVINHVFTTGGNEDIGTFAGGAQPAISTKMRLNAFFTNHQGAPKGAAILLQNFPLTAAIPAVFVAGVSLTEAVASGGNSAATGITISFTPRTGSELWAVAGGNLDNLLVGAMGFDHRVRRLVAGY